ncbi:ATP-binding protein [Planctomycetota bacterium]
MNAFEVIEDRFEVLDHMPVGVCVIDKNYMVKFWNSCMEDWTNIHRDYMLTAELGDNFPCFNEPMYRCRIDNIFNGGPPVIFSAQLHKDIFPSPLPDGNLRKLNTMATAVPVSDGKGFNAIIVVEDITELTHRIDKYRQTQDKLAKSEEIYRLIFDNSAVAIMMADDQERLISWNKFAENLLGMNKEDLFLKPVKSLYPAEEWQRIRSHNVREKGMQPHLESKIITKDGKVVDVDVSLSVLKDTEGKIISSVGIIKDITERKRSEQASMQARDDLETANLKLKRTIEHTNTLAHEAMMASKTKSEFLANMSHEIRTPMNGIVGAITLVLTKNLDEKVREYLTIAQKCTENLLNLINDILDISKIEAGKLEVELVDCDISKELCLINSCMRASALEKGLDFDIVLKDNIPQQIRTDPTRLYQCLVNLVGNAVKFTETGTVRLEASMQQIADRSFICFDVIDTGIGIPDDKQAQIFDKFTQADGSTTRKYGGTGLGLAITKQLVELLGGELTLTSQETKGSTFSLIIPTNINTESAAMMNNGRWRKTNQQADQDAIIPKACGKVLVVEDDLANQQIISGILEETNLEVEIANDGVEAVEKVSKGSYALVLMDMQMPNMNGYDATRIIREKGFTLPIIALTAYAMKGDEDICRRVGCDAYLSKPVDVEKLFKTLKKYLTFDSNL